MDSLKKFTQFFGLHPLVGFGMFAVDMMLFGGELATAGIGWMITVPIGLALSIPCALLQHYSYKDDWGTAIGKGMLIGLLTAIPTALPAVVPAIGGVVGAVNMLRGGSVTETEAPPPVEETK
jgi:hypothetical protein